MTEEKITIGKAVSGICKPKNFVKLGIQSINLGLIIVLLLGGITIFKFFFPNKNKQIQNQRQTSSVVFERESGIDNVTIVTSQDQKQEEQKRIVGLEVSLTSDDAGVGVVKYINDNLAVTGGIRYRFDAKDDENEVVPEIKLRWDF